MSQLADSVALPDISDREGRDESTLARAGTGVERVRLMVLAEGESGLGGVGRSAASCISVA